MACQFNTGEVASLDELDEYIQDALDLIGSFQAQLATTIMIEMGLKFLRANMLHIPLARMDQGGAPGKQHCRRRLF